VIAASILVLSIGAWAGVAVAIVAPFGFPGVLLAVGCVLAIAAILEPRS
jgi:hypothetical protein